jgi:hypothetical protein
MTNPTRDPVLEERIRDKAIVDAYGPEEQAMSWYYYLEDQINFPFRAKCIAAIATSPFVKENLSKSDAWPRKTHAPAICSC